MDDQLLYSVMNQAAGTVQVPEGLYPTARLAQVRPRRLPLLPVTAMSAVAAAVLAVVLAVTVPGQVLVQAATGWVVSSFKVVVRKGYHPQAGAVVPRPGIQPPAAAKPTTVADLRAGEWPLPTDLAPPKSTPVTMKTTRTTVAQGEVTVTDLDLSYPVEWEKTHYTVTLSVHRTKLPEPLRAARLKALEAIRSGHDPALVSPEALATHEVTIHGQATTVVDIGAGFRQAIWYSEEQTVTLLSNLPLAEFTKVAESMPSGR